MSKKGLFGLIAAVIITATAAIVLLLPSTEPKDTSSKTEIKSSTTKRLACVTADSAAVVMGSDERMGLEMAVMGERPTVPAGTNADIFVDKYDGKKATGSILYGGGYGNYSFAATKGGDWKVTEFDECAS